MSSLFSFQVDVTILTEKNIYKAVVAIAAWICVDCCSCLSLLHFASGTVTKIGLNFNTLFFISKDRLSRSIHGIFFTILNTCNEATIPFRIIRERNLREIYYNELFVAWGFYHFFYYRSFLVTFVVFSILLFLQTSVSISVSLLTCII